MNIQSAVSNIITSEYPESADIFLFEKDHLFERLEKKVQENFATIIKEEKNLQLDGFGFSGEQIPEYLAVFISLVTFYYQFTRDKKNDKLKEGKKTLLKRLLQSGLSEKKANSITKKFFDEIE